MFRLTDADLDTQPTLTPTQQRLTRALKNTGFLPGCRYFLTGSLQNQLAMCQTKFFMYAGFSTATRAMFGQKQTLMLHLFTATNKALQSTFRRASCVTFRLGLTCYTDGSVHRFTGCLLKKSFQKHVVPARRCCGFLCTSGPKTSHCHLQ